MFDDVRRRIAGLIGIVAAGLLSRVVRTGFVVFDKYLGDMLYAAMVYVIFRFAARPLRAAIWATIVMTAIELFQLTLIPAKLAQSSSGLIRICARLMGTQFSFLDLLAYGIGIGMFCMVECRERSRVQRSRT
jgi:hypothetical protein